MTSVRGRHTGPGLRRDRLQPVSIIINYTVDPGFRRGDMTPSPVRRGKKPHHRWVLSSLKRPDNIGFYFISANGVNVPAEMLVVMLQHWPEVTV